MTTLGVWSDNAPGHSTQDLEAKIGRKFAGYRFNKSFGSPVPGSSEQSAYDVGSQPFSIYRNSMSEDKTLGANFVLRWANWPSGQYDHYLDAMVVSINTDPRFTPSTPYLFAFHHEPYSQHEANSTPEQYKSAFRHISQYLRARIDSRLQLVFDDVLAGITKGTYDPDLDSTGKRVGSYYDILGLDCYQKPVSGHLKRTPALVTKAASARAKAAGITFAWFECGVAEGSAGEKAAFFTEMVPALKSYGTGPGSCSGLYYSNVGLVSGKDLYYPDTTPESLAAFKAMATDPYFAA